MRVKKYVIDLPPVAWKRVERSGRGANAHFYDGQTQIKTMYGLKLIKAHANEPIWACPVDMEMIFFMPMPKTNRKLGGVPCIGRSDLDNLCKFLLDTAVDAEVLQDDNIVCSMSAKKLYDKEPRIEFILTEIII